SAEQALGGTPDEPDMAVAFDPVGDAVSVRTRAALLRRRVRFGCPASKRGAMFPKRADAALRILRSADGRAKVHHRLSEITRVSGEKDCLCESLDLRLRRPSDAVKPSDY